MTAWQSLVFMAGSLLFALLLLPTIKDEEASVPLATSVPTGTILLIYALTFLTMDGHLLSAAGSLASAIAWFYIAVFRR